VICGAIANAIIIERLGQYREIAFRAEKFE
jgi:hypothetical protein